MATRWAAASNTFTEQPQALYQGKERGHLLKRESSGKPTNCCEQANFRRQLARLDTARQREGERTKGDACRRLQNLQQLANYFSACRIQDYFHRTRIR